MSWACEKQARGTSQHWWPWFKTHHKSWGIFSKWACVDQYCGNLARLLGWIFDIGICGQGLCPTELPWQHPWLRTWGTDRNLTENAPVYMWYKQRNFKKSSKTENECECTWRDSCLFVSCLSHPFFHSVLLILFFKPLYSHHSIHTSKLYLQWFLMLTDLSTQFR